MADVFLALIKQLNSSVFVLLALLLPTFWGSTKVANKIGRWTEKFQAQNEKITDLRDLSKEVIVMKTKVDLIYQQLNPNSTVKSMSPLSLTETAEKIMTQINADQIFNKYTSQLTQEIALSSPKTAYDIQMAAMKVAKEKLANLLNEREINAMKQEAYANGILLEDVFAIFGILLRNHILREKGIPIAEVDSH